MGVGEKQVKLKKEFLSRTGGRKGIADLKAQYFIISLKAAESFKRSTKVSKIP